MPLEPQQFPDHEPTRFIEAGHHDGRPRSRGRCARDREADIVWIGWANELPPPSRVMPMKRSTSRRRARYPRLCDAHMHAVMLANFAPLYLVLPPNITSIAELTEAIRARRAAQGPNAWVEGWGYHQALLAEQRSPTRWDLDAGSPDAPYDIMRTCGHIRCVNSRALEDRWHHARHALSCWRRN